MLRLGRTAAPPCRKINAVHATAAIRWQGSLSLSISPTPDLASATNPVGRGFSLRSARRSRFRARRIDRTAISASDANTTRVAAIRVIASDDNWRHVGLAFNTHIVRREDAIAIFGVGMRGLGQEQEGES
jgi:hypothetical protein